MVERALTMVPHSVQDIEFFLETLQLPRSVLMTYQELCFSPLFWRLESNVLPTIQNIQRVATVMQQLNVSYTEVQTVIGDNRDIFYLLTNQQISASCLTVRFVSYVKKASLLSGIPIVGNDWFQMYYNMNKHIPISNESKTRLSILHEHLQCEPQKPYQIFHVLITRANQLIHNQSILLNQDPNVSYKELVVPIQGNTYRLPRFECDSQYETLFIVSSIGFTSNEFAVLTQIMTDINQTIHQSNVILLHDTLYHVWPENQFSHFRKVVNCYSIDDIPPRQSPLGRLILAKTNHFLDARESVQGVSIYSYAYFQEEKKKSHLVSDTWWYIYFIRSIPCARGRVLQASGTCWFNTILNTLLLTLPLKEYLGRIQYSPSFSNYVNMINGTYQFTYHLPHFIRTRLQDNIPQEQTVFNQLIQQSQQNGSFMETFVIPFQAFFYRRIHGKLNLDNRVLLELSKLINMMKTDAGFISNISRLLSFLQIPCDVYDQIDYSMNELRANVLQSTQPFVLIKLILSDEESIPLQIGNYKLHAAGLRSPEHAVAGLMCHDIPYIYDSNNVIAYSNWPDNDFSGYYEKSMELKNSPIELYNYITYAEFFLYIRL